MRKISIIVLMLFLTSCVGLQTMPTLETPSQKLAYAKGMVTAVNNSTTQLLIADVISVEEAKSREAKTLQTKSLISAYETAIGTSDEITEWRALNIILLELNKYLLEKETQ